MTQPLLEILNPLTFPLHGNRLIEASAGTGKTYTITGLYIRLLLGHGDDDTAHKSPLTVDQILVVTFTEAATAELRDRIRARIHETRLAFLDGESNDPLIQTLLRDLSDHSTCAEQLLVAEQQMDEAAVFTIHGFCQRMLKQFAFESGTLFSNELLTDQEPLLQETVADFWRSRLYPADKPLAAVARKTLKSPTDLANDIRGWLSQGHLDVVAPGLPKSESHFFREYVEPLQEIKRAWCRDADQLREDLAGVLKKKARGIRDFRL